MPALGSYPNKSPPPRQKPGCKSPRVGANVWCKFPRVRAGGGVVMDETDSCIRTSVIVTVCQLLELNTALIR